ncbi:MAG: triacylglycerol lipase, partial [Lachnospiraceae bacterium]|nr:triacylglycerol lipase [Lachnospiraceae bacterium]
MKKFARMFQYVCFGILLFAASNFYALCQTIGFIVLLLGVYVFINIAPLFLLPKTKRLKACARGNALLIEFLISTALSVGFFIRSLLIEAPELKLILINTLFAILLEAIVFWNGIIRVYIRSKQLGIKIRVIGIVCGLIPIAQLVALGLIIKTVSEEITFENRRFLMDEKRKDLRICATKYPILMVHGVFFRDFRFLNYWGRIPEALQNNGAKVFYGNHQSAAAVAQSGQEISDRILQIINETGCEKVNI